MKNECACHCAGGTKKGEGPLFSSSDDPQVDRLYEYGPFVSLNAVPRGKCALRLNVLSICRLRAAYGRDEVARGAQRRDRTYTPPFSLDPFIAFGWESCASQASTSVSRDCWLSVI